MKKKPQDITVRDRRAFNKKIAALTAEVKLLKKEFKRLDRIVKISQ